MRAGGPACRGPRSFMLSAAPARYGMPGVNGSSGSSAASAAESGADGPRAPGPRPAGPDRVALDERAPRRGADRAGHREPVGGLELPHRALHAGVERAVDVDRDLIGAQQLLRDDDEIAGGPAVQGRPADLGVEVRDAAGERLRDPAPLGVAGVLPRPPADPVGAVLASELAEAARGPSSAGRRRSGRAGRRAARRAG